MHETFRYVTCLLTAFGLRIGVSATDITSRACIPIDPSFRCHTTYAPLVDYADITGEATIPTIQICPCSLFPETEPYLELTDLAVLCALSPRPVAEDLCDPAPVSDALMTHLTWQTSQLPLEQCPSETFDLSGHCGDTDAVQKFATVCSLRTNMGKDESILMPFVSLTDVELISAGENVVNDCTKLAYDTFAKPIGIACANRTCDITTPRTTHRSTCDTLDITDACSLPVNVVSYNCMQSSGALTYDHAGCASSLSVSLCGGSDTECSTRRPSDVESCVPTTHCNSTFCVNDLDTCTVSGSYTNGTSCRYTCPARNRTFRVEKGPCMGSECGGEGYMSMLYIACNASGIGCLAYPNPQNETVACNTDPCPCEGTDCESKPGKVYYVLDGEGSICESSTLDVLGNCCHVPTHDACGLCDGAEYDGVGTVRVGIDVEGQCCSGSEQDEPILTSGLECCKTIDVDVCGVCKGDGTSCVISIETTLDTRKADEVALRMSTALHIAVRPMPDGSLLLPAGSGAHLEYVTHGYLTAVSSVQERKPKTVRDHSYQGSEVVLKSLGIAGNGYCEIGESPNVEPACIGAVSTCLAFVPSSSFDQFLGDPSQPCGGNGVCIKASRTCSCFFGYTGLTCGSCSPGFRPFPIGRSGPSCISSLSTVMQNDSNQKSPFAIIVGSISSAFVAAIAGILARRFNMLGAVFARMRKLVPESGGDDV